MVLSGFKVHYWPGLLLGIYIFTVLVTYVIAVLNKHVHSFFPYISDSGTVPPESCIFGQLFNIMAVVLAITLYLRYRQVDFDITSGNIDIDKKWNTVTMWLAVSMSLGTSIAGNFQETAVLVVHVAGAAMVFGTGLVYFLLQTRISFASRCKTNPVHPNYGISRKMLYLRVFISISNIPLFAINGICGALALTKFKGLYCTEDGSLASETRKLLRKSMNLWSEQDGGFQLRLASTFTEWIFVTFMFVYIFTYTNEFKSLKFKEIKFSSKFTNLKNENQEML